MIENNHDLYNEILSQILEETGFSPERKAALFRRRQELAQAINNLGSYYPPSYKGPPHYLDQIRTLLEFWPELKADKAIRYINEIYENSRVPKWVEGVYLRPRPGIIADDFVSEFRLALQALKERGILLKDNMMDNLHKDSLVPQVNSIGPYLKLVESQAGSDIIVIPAQFGSHHSQKTAADLDRGFKTCYEFGLDAVTVAFMLLVDPGRFETEGDLGIDCQGTVYLREDEDRDTEKITKGVLSFSFSDRVLSLDGFHRHDRGYCGIATGYLLH